MILSRCFRVIAFTSTLLVLSASAEAVKPGEQDPALGIRLAQAKPNPPKRKFVEGVVTTVKPDFQAKETHSEPHALTEVVRGIPNVNWTPSYLAATRTLEAKSTGVTFRRDIWGLEFSFKPLRMLKLDVPQPSGKMQKKLIWYMVYSVKNTGDPLRAVPTKDQFDNVIYQAKKVDGLPSPAIRFFPRFLLETQDRMNPKTNEPKAYLDRVIPLADKVIAERETGGSDLFNSVDINMLDIPVSTPEEDNSVWGVVTWEDVDPETDFVSVYVQGLTNAYKWVDDTDSYQPGDAPGKHRKLLQKTLKLNFWRPGDKYQEHEGEIRLGVPSRPGIKGQVDYEWVYR